ncbi:MAG: protein adenylyltransferase SelO family protein, partial [Novosphingobium sp.]|nr:protein adenylyltransferase SelO family protein [Novosphingobium sp.]
IVESFDYGPWRWLPEWNPGFTAAYFDRTGLYCFARQPQAIAWNCAQLAGSLMPIAPEEALIAAVNRYSDLFPAALARRFLWRLGIGSLGTNEDVETIAAMDDWMRAEKLSPDAVFFTHRCGRNPPANAFGERLRRHPPADGLAHPLWTEDAPPTMVIEEVERVWDAIDKDDDWRPLMDKIADVRRLGEALGPTFG